MSAETVHDFQLLPGDAITLRLQDGKTKQYVDVPFHYVGVAKEFPTAPHDSFLLANADYIAKMTGSDTVGAFLVDTGGSNVANIADTSANSLASPQRSPTSPAAAQSSDPVLPRSTSTV